MKKVVMLDKKLFRIKHRQPNRKTIVVFQDFSSDESKEIDNFDIILKINNFYIVRLLVNTDFENLKNKYGLKKIDIT